MDCWSERGRFTSWFPVLAFYWQVAKDMSQRLCEVTALAEDNQRLMQEAEDSAKQVSVQSEKLEVMVRKYKVAS